MSIKTKPQPRRRRGSSMYYENQEGKCHWVLSDRKSRCPKPCLKDKNLCAFHDKLRDKQRDEYNSILKTKGGAASAIAINPKKLVYDYDYYLDKDIEPFDSCAALVAPKVWIGSIDSANDVNFLKNNGIKCVMNASGMEPSITTREMYRKLGVEYKTLSRVEKLPNKSYYSVTDYLGDEPFSKKGLTPRQFYKYMQKGCKMLNQSSKGPVLIHCFTEEHQLLTNKGFMFLHEVEAYKGDDLLFGSYNPSTKKLIYQKGDLVVNPYVENQRMIDMTFENERRRWEEGSDCYGRRENNEIESPTNMMSLIATPGHEMYVKHGLLQQQYENKKKVTIYWKSRKKWNEDKTEYKYIQTDYQNITAEELLSDNEREYAAFLGLATQGVASMTNYVLPFVQSLSLESTEQISAFLEVYGYWLGDGSLAVSADTPGSNAITFSPVKPIDVTWLDDRFKILELNQFKKHKTNHTTQYAYYIYDKEWVNIFVKEYQRKYKNGFRTEEEELLYESSKQCKSAKWMMPWVWDLNMDQCRKVLSGLRMADGCEAHDTNSIYSSSVKFRDEIVKLSLHAGYSPIINLMYAKGTNRGIINGKDVIATCDAWKISYNSPGQFGEPNLKRSRDIKEVIYSGRTWCATVPPYNFVIVRRAYFDKEKGYVTKASRPIISKNCHAGVNRSASLVAAHLMTKPKPYTYERVLEMLKEANKRRGLDVLTNSDFKKSLKYYPLYAGTRKPENPQILSRYKQYLTSYEQ